MISAEDLLKPISEDSPCGEDLSYDPAFNEIEALLAGKPEGSANEKPKEPDWRKVHGRCLDLYSRCKHLRLAAILTLTSLKLDGVPGFQQGLTLLSGLLDRYWDTVYPRLDAEEHNDPTERVNILGAFTAPAGGLGDVMNFLVRLRQAPLCRSRTGQYSASDITQAEAGAAGAPSIPDIKLVFAESDPAAVELVRSAVAAAIEDVRQIDDFLNRALGVSSGRSWKGLSGVLEELGDRLAKYGPGPALAAGAPAIESAPGSPVASVSSSGAGLRGIQSRNEVVRYLDTVCEYYRRSEPSSPIPLLLRCAQRLVDKDFLEIMEHLTPEALATLKQIAGPNGS